MRVERILVAGLAAALASAAGAASVDVSFFNVTNTASPNIAGQLKLTVADVAGQPNKVDFILKNFATVASSIQEFYFDTGGINNIFASGAIQAQNGSSFTFGSANPGSLPGGNTLTPAFETTPGLLGDAGSGGPTAGLDAVADSLTVRLTLAAGKTFNDVLLGLASNPSAAGSIRVGLHVISIGGGGSDSFATVVVPLPSAALAGMSGMAMVGFVRRRR